MPGMLRNIGEFYGAAQRPVALINEFTLAHLLHEHARADHLCYKCGSRESYEEILRFFEGESQWIHLEQISGRTIAYIKLVRSIPTVLGDIEYLELADQKQGGSQEEGFHHIEFYPLRQSYDEMVSHFRTTERVEEIVREHHTTHEMAHHEGFRFCCTREPLVENIRERMKRAQK